MHLINSGGNKMKTTKMFVRCMPVMALAVIIAIILTFGSEIG
jgi:hypothetical protein